MVGASPCGRPGGGLTKLGPPSRAYRDDIHLTLIGFLIRMPRISGPTPERARLIAEVVAFVRAAQRLPGITRIALIGS